MNYPAAEQRGILKNIERPKGRGIKPSSAYGGLKLVGLFALLFAGLIFLLT
ncbi:MAG TPA: hypothetical protein PK874_11255 [Desulfobacteraceae bacterium]|nr:hypothetical protein [Desulfobacteraceae bacterium]HPJ66287.1 hypothetical protein [Desulfobacteraceae bacterium]